MVFRSYWPSCQGSHRRRQLPPQGPRPPVMTHAARQFLLQDEFLDSTVTAATRRKMTTRATAGIDEEAFPLSISLFLSVSLSLFLCVSLSPSVFPGAIDLYSVLPVISLSLSDVAYDAPTFGEREREGGRDMFQVDGQASFLSILRYLRYLRITPVLDHQFEKKSRIKSPPQTR